MNTNEPLSSVTGGEFLEWLIDHYVLQNNELVADSPLAVGSLT